MQEVLGTQNLITNTGELKIADLSNSKIIGLYFTAHWCPPCRTFTPKLMSLYRSYNTSQHFFEIVFVSYDRDSETMHNYFEEMPWAAVPYSDQDLRESLGSRFGVTGIPALVIFSSDGTLISSDGRSDVYAKNAEVMEYWVKKTESPGAAEEAPEADDQVEESTFSRDPVEGLVCDKNHSLIWQGDVGRHYKELRGDPNIRCSYCKATLRRSSWHCRECNFDLCRNCRDWVAESRQQNDPNLRCWNLHKLLGSDRLNEYYLKKFGVEKYTCRSCNTPLSGSNLHCRRCYFDMCGNCQKSIEVYAPVSSVVNCTEGHAVAWNPETSKTYLQIYGVPRYPCSICSGIYNGAGSFNCLPCTYDVCVLCIGTLIESISQ